MIALDRGNMLIKPSDRVYTPGNNEHMKYNYTKLVTTQTYCMRPGLTIISVKRVCKTQLLLLQLAVCEKFVKSPI